VQQIAALVRHRHSSKHTHSTMQLLRPPIDALQCRPCRMSLRKQSSWATTVHVSAVGGCAQQHAAVRAQLRSGGLFTSNMCVSNVVQLCG
jgi:hypothetical protein